MKFQIIPPVKDWGRYVGVWVGTLFSPAWPILKTAFAPYIDVETLLAKGAGLSGIQSFYTQLNALDAQILLGHIMPVLLAGIIASLGYLYICSWLGQVISRYAVRGYRFATSSIQT